MGKIKFILDEKVFYKNENWIFTIIKYYNDGEEILPVEISTVGMILTKKKNVNKYNSVTATPASGLTEENAIRRKGCHKVGNLKRFSVKMEEKRRIDQWERKPSRQSNLRRMFKDLIC